MPLIGKQETTANQVLKYLESNNNYRQKTIYIAGEMGVGKTYISSYIVDKLLKNEDKPHILIISPQANILKWQDVLAEYTHLQSNLSGKINENSIIDICNYKNITGYERSSNIEKYTAIIIDEIHTLNKSKANFKSIKNLVQKQHNANAPILALTGTIFNTNIYKLGPIIELTHPKLFTHYFSKSTHFADFEKKYKNNRILFFSNFWQNIAISISLNDVKSLTPKKDEVHQDIAPIKLINPSMEEILFYEIMVNQYKSIGHTPKNAKFLAAQRIDDPEVNTPLTKKKHVMHAVENQEHNLNIRGNFEIEVASVFMIENKTIETTQKFKRLLDLLQNKEKTLIFANDALTINHLIQALKKHNIIATTLPSDISPEYYSQYINQELTNNCDVFIINPKAISTGVDINTASRIIWYQIIEDLTETLQAQRRVYRLSSKKSSTIYYLAYDKTYQKDLINEISNNSKNNALSYAVRDTSNLAKLTGILFNTIN